MLSPCAIDATLTQGTNKAGRPQESRPFRTAAAGRSTGRAHHLGEHALVSSTLRARARELTDDVDWTVQLEEGRLLQEDDLRSLADLLDEGLLQINEFARRFLAHSEQL